MNAAALLDEIIPGKTGEGLAARVSRSFVLIWLEAVERFRAQERQRIYLAEPSERELRQHLQDLKAMIRLALMMQREMNDPDFPGDRSRLQDVNGQLLQLTASLNTLQDPMTETEAESILRGAFPDESGAGRAA